MKNKYLVSIFILACSIATAQFVQKPLPYTFNALEPYIDAQTMEIHYSKHHAGYVKNLNIAISGTTIEKLSLQEIFGTMATQTPAVRNNAGGHYNHELFWSILTPEKNTKPSTDLELAINESFGSFDGLKEKLTAAASTRFGSGWAWLSVDKDKKLIVSSTPNQDNPLMDITEIKGIPILAIDVWEHAYYLKYQNKRTDYLAAIWNIINWNQVSSNYKSVTKDKFDEWLALKEFKKVLEQTFFPSKEGNLEPINRRSGELAQKAITLSKSIIPEVFNKKEVVLAVQKLAINAKKLDKMVKNKKSNQELEKALNNLNDEFYQLNDLCFN